MKSIQFHIVAFVLLMQITGLFSQTPDTTMSKIYAMDIEELMNTKVSIATKSDKSINETPSIVSVITAEEIKNMGVRELEDILQTIPGFELNRAYAGYINMGVRGVKDSRGTSKILVLLDGTPINQVFWGGSILWGYDINTDNIERIEIIRGPGSALYGRNAFSAVINIITKSIKSHKLYIKGELGSFDTKAVSASGGLSIKKVNAHLALKAIKTDITNEKFDNGFGSISPWNLKKENLIINSKISYKNFTFNAMYQGQYSGASFLDSWVTNNTFHFALSHSLNISPRFSINTKIYGQHSKYLEDIEFLPANTETLIPRALGGNDTIRYKDFWPLGIYYKPQYKSYIIGFENDINYKISANNELLFGIQADLHGVNDVIIPANISNFNYLTPIPNADRNNQVIYEPGWFKNNKHNYYNIAFLLQDIWYPVHNVGITLGSRLDIDKETGSIINPRLGLVFTPFKNTPIKLLYGKAYRAPAPGEQYVTLGYVVGNEKLKPEVINTFEASISNRFKNINQSLSFYVNKLTNLIYAARILYVSSENQYYNIGKNTSIGIEYENKMVLTKNIYTFFNYSYTHSINKDSANFTDTTYNHPDIAPHKINLGINYSFLKRFNLNINLYYRSKMEPFKISGTNLYVQNTIGNYTILNAAFQINNMLINGFGLKISGFNLLDTKYYSQDNQHLYQPPQPGRQLIASLIFTLP